MIKQDRRIVRTKLLLREALARLLERQPLMEISVNDLVEEAGVSRTSFYRNYQDKEAFVNSVMDEVLGGIFAVGNLAGDAEKPVPSSEQYYLRFFQYIQTNQVFFRFMADSGKWPEFRQRFQENGMDAYGRIIGQRTLTGGIPSQVLIAYIVSAHVGVISYWMEDGCRYAPQFMAHWLSQLTVEGPMKLSGLDEQTLRQLPR